MKMTDGESSDLDRPLGAVRTLEPIIRTQADETEQGRRLSPSVVTALADAGMFQDPRAVQAILAPLARSGAPAPPGPAPPAPAALT